MKKYFTISIYTTFMWCLYAPYADSFAAGVVNATKSGNSNILVRGGTHAQKGEYEEAVVIDMGINGTITGFCSGVLLTPTVVLSAAHCARKGVTPVRVTASDSISNAIPLGKQVYASAPIGTTIPSVQSVAVTSFEVTDLAAVLTGEELFGRDIMLIWLAAPLNFPVLPISVPALDNIHLVKVVRIVGFGTDGTSKNGKKLWADVDVVLPRCNPDQGSGAEIQCARGAELLARDPTGKYDSCPGDSGGPVYTRNVGGDLKLIGITSRAPYPSMACGGGTFVTLLDGFRLKWIQERASGIVLTGAIQPEAPTATNLSTCKPPQCDVQ